MFGYSGRGFQRLDEARPARRSDAVDIRRTGLAKSRSLSAWPKDWNNIGPAIGFAWQVPWFGAGQTTVRGGYQLSFLPGGGGRFNTISTPLANPPGSSYQATITGGPGDLEYLDLTDSEESVPVPVPVKPMGIVPVTARDTGLTAFDSHLVTPYVQNLTLAVTRNVGENVTMDARYIGTLSRKLYGTIEINSPNFLYNGLKEAFDAARAGGESALLDQMFKGVNIAGAGFGPVGTRVQRRAADRRAAAAGRRRRASFRTISPTATIRRWRTVSAR